MPQTKRYFAIIGLVGALLLPPNALHADIGKPIAFIRVEGTQRVERETVLTYMIISEGMIDEAELVDRSVKTLFASGLFSDVRIRREDDGLVVVVVENPIINRIAFEGNRKINDDRLGEESVLRPRQIYTRAKVQDDVERFIELYRRSGRFAARIEPKIIQLPQNRIDLVFEIDEGPVTGIRSIKFIGNQAFSDRRLRDEIVTRQSRWWRFLSSNDNYDPDRIAYDGEVLRRFYLSKGYADFRVVNTSAELTRDGREFFVTFTIEEGEKYKFGAAQVVSDLQSIDTDALHDTILHEEGATYDARAIDGSIDALTKITGELGFAFAEIRPRVSRDRENRVISIDYVVEEGERVYVERININGNDRTRDNVIRREIRLAEGDAFNSILLNRSERDIRGLDFFSNVEIAETPGSTEDQTIIDVNVREKSTGRLTFGLGFSSSENFVAQLGFSERNFLGKGQRVGASVGLSRRSQNYSVSFTEPYFLGRDVAAGVNVFRRSTRYRNTSGVRTSATGGGLSLAYKLSENGQIRLFTNFSEEQLTNSSASRLVNPSYDLIKHEVGYYYSIDRRNDFIEPTDGWNFGFGQTVATPAGDIRFIRATTTANYYKELAEGWVFHARGTAGYVQSYKKGDPVRYTDRFFRGGTTFRGFDRAGVGPRQRGTNYTLGANKYAIGTFELSLPIGLPKELGIRTNAFVDFGAIGDVDTERLSASTVRSIQDEFAFRATYGLSVSWRSPFGPVRFDFAGPIAKEDYDRTRFFRFSIGTRF